MKPIAFLVCLFLCSCPSPTEHKISCEQKCAAIGYVVGAIVYVEGAVGCACVPLKQGGNEQQGQPLSTFKPL